MRGRCRLCIIFSHLLALSSLLVEQCATRCMQSWLCFTTSIRISLKEDRIEFI